MAKVVLLCPPIELICKDRLKQDRTSKNVSYARLCMKEDMKDDGEGLHYFVTTSIFMDFNHRWAWGWVRWQ